MLGIYFSGTGNTKHCIEKLTQILDSEAKVIALEDENIVEEIKNNDRIILGYSVQFSNIPYMLRDFIKRNNEIWKGKKILCVATMGAFSGDGGGICARLLRKYDACILGTMHIKMPDSVGDVKLLKKSLEENLEMFRLADAKIEKIASDIKDGKYPKEGDGIFAQIVGLLGQRLWTYPIANKYSKKIKISNECTKCGLCVKICPMKNLKIENEKVVTLDKCTMCYRCISSCPKKAITLLGSKVHTQYRYDKSIEESSKNLESDTLIVESNSFIDNGYMLKKNTGFGEDISPDLKLINLCLNAKSIAIIMDDLDVPFSREYNHWTLWNMIPQSIIPEGISMISNKEKYGNFIQGVGYGKNRYRGPKQPIFVRKMHRYRFEIFVLDQMINLDESATKKELIEKIEGHIIQKGTITGKYKRSMKNEE